jgi:hypothetical protein
MKKAFIVRRGTARRASTIAIFIILLSSYARVSLQAQDYHFSVPRLEMDVEIQKDGSAILKYDLDFENARNAHAIDIVDVGMPNDKYYTGNMSAALDGEPSRDIRDSEYVKPGVEVHLPGRGIPMGGSGNFTFEAQVSDLVFQDTTRNDYASFQITPTWFDNKFVENTTQQIIRVYLPDGVNSDEVLYQDVPFTKKEVIDGRVVVTWETYRRLVGSFRVGISFPKRVMDRIVKMTITEMMMRWYYNTFSEGTRIALIIASVATLAFVFFRFTGGTGGCLFVVLLIAMWIWLGKWAPVQILIWPILLILGIIVENVRRRKKKYLSAIASVEGGGIKRGLTAPEAAALLELPANKVITLVLFGMLKKGLVRQKKDPVIFIPEKNPPPDAIVQTYEKIVLEALKKKEDKPIGKIDFNEVFNYIVESLVMKMKGFNLEETREYYKQIISRAWKEAQEVGDIEAWQNRMDEKVDWMMLDPDFNDRFGPYNTRYIPRSYRTSWGGGSSSGGGSKAPSGTSGGPKFADIAASITGWMQNTSGQVVSGLEGQKGGVLNLKGFDKAVGEMLASSGSGRGGGGGGCACAGCACACACAGGGR